MWKKLKEFYFHPGALFLFALCIGLAIMFDRSGDCPLAMAFGGAATGLLLPQLVRKR